MKFLQVLIIMLATISGQSFAQSADGELTSYAKGKQLMETGRYDEAITQFSNMLKGGDSDSVLLMRATAYYLLGKSGKKGANFDKAMKDVNASLKINDAYEQAYYQRALITKELAVDKNTAEAIQRYLKARSDLAKALEINPAYKEAEAEIKLIDQTIPELRNNSK